MNQDLTTKEGVAKILEASELFNNRKKFPLYLDGVGAFNRSDSLYYCGFGPWLDANQSEAILEQLGVQVVWNSQGNCYYIAQDGEGDVFLDKDLISVKFKGIPRQDRELASAATVAWFAIKEPEKLREAVAALEQQK